MKILVVEDDAGLAEMLAKTLKTNHYQVELAADGESGLALADVYDYDLVLLDLRLPKLDGIHFCRKLRSAGGDVPILLMTAEDTTASKIAGLDAGADDYVIKPLDIGELLARVRALLRRGRAETSPVLSWGAVTLNPSACEVLSHSERLHLTGKEYELLELFLRNPHRIFSLNVLLERLWAYEKVPSDNALRTHIKSLRRKLKKSDVHEMIETVYGLGYRLGPEPFEPSADEPGNSAQGAAQKPVPSEAPPLEVTFPASATSLSSPNPPFSTAPFIRPTRFTFSGTAFMSATPSFSPGDHAARSSAAPNDPALERLQEIWQRHQQKYLDLITGLGKIIPVLDVAPGELASSLAMNRALITRSQQAIHTLKGALGSFGFLKASQIASQIEKILVALPQLDREQVDQLPGLIHAMRKSLQPVKSDTCQAQNVHEQSVHEPAETGATGRWPNTVPSTLPNTWSDLSNHRISPSIYQWLIIDNDQTLIEELIRQASIWGIQARIATTPEEAWQALEQHSPNVVMLDPTCAATLDAGLSFLQALIEQRPSLPVIVSTDQDTLSDRVKILRSSGGATFLPKPVAANQILEIVNQSLSQTTLSGARILALDDDPAILQCLQQLLAPWGFQLTLLSDPLQFWDALEQTSPDLLILDIEMPDFNGLELCQVIRSDPRLGQLPVLFLSAHTGPDIVRHVFEAGADDYISKPIMGAELVARILNRLERLQLLRKLAETDSLTGLSCRRCSVDAFNKLLKLAARQEATLCLALLDLDKFKQINDVHGHDVGDHVLKTLGAYLKQAFRGEDVVARWGGEEFVVGLYDSSKLMAIQRLNDFLETFRQHVFTGADTAEGTPQSFQVSFSGGVAAYPTDGNDIQTLYRSADRALYRAKAAGRNQILPAEKD